MSDRIKNILAYIDESEKAIDLENHRIRFVISTDEIDRDGEIVEVQAVAKAVLAKNFVDNPVCLSSHKHDLPTGHPSVIGHWDVSTFKASKHRSEMFLNFADDTYIGGEYWKLYSKRHMRAVSIGFRVGDGYSKTADGRNIFIITKIEEMIEISCVAVGANVQALAKIKGFHLESPLDTKGLAEQVSKAVSEKITQQITIWLNENETIIQIQEQIDEIKTLLIADKDELAERLLGNASETQNSAGEDSMSSEQKAKIAKLLSEIKENL